MSRDFLQSLKEHWRLQPGQAFSLNDMMYLIKDDISIRPETIEYIIQHINPSDVPNIINLVNMQINELNSKLQSYGNSASFRFMYINAENKKRNLEMFLRRLSEISGHSFSSPGFTPGFASGPAFGSMPGFAPGPTPGFGQAPGFAPPPPPGFAPPPPPGFAPGFGLNFGKASASTPAFGQINDPTCPSKNRNPRPCLNKKDYKEQMLIFHPDKNTGCQAEASEKTKILNGLPSCNFGGRMRSKKHRNTYKKRENIVRKQRRNKSKRKRMSKKTVKK